MLLVNEDGDEGGRALGGGGREGFSETRERRKGLTLRSNYLFELNRSANLRSLDRVRGGALMLNL